MGRGGGGKGTEEGDTLRTFGEVGMWLSWHRGALATRARATRRLDGGGRPEEHRRAGRPPFALAAPAHDRGESPGDGRKWGMLLQTNRASSALAPPPA